MKMMKITQHMTARMNNHARGKKNTMKKRFCVFEVEGGTLKKKNNSKLLCSLIILEFRIKTKRMCWILLG